MSRYVSISRRFSLLILLHGICCLIFLLSWYVVLGLPMRLIVCLSIWWYISFEDKFCLCIVYCLCIQNLFTGNILESRPEFSLIIGTARFVSVVLRDFNNPFFNKSFLNICPFSTILSIELGLLIYNSYINFGTRFLINRLTCCSSRILNGHQLTKFCHPFKNVTKDSHVFYLVVQRSIMVTSLSILKVKW